jgi:DNA polymerase III sliding clamp (beta) subunit (PCNA family)
MKIIKTFESFINEGISTSEESKIVTYLDSLKDETLFNFNDDAHGESDDAATVDQWNSNKNDLDHSDLVDFALDHVVNFSIKLKELKKLISSTYA